MSKESIILEVVDNMANRIDELEAQIKSDSQSKISAINGATTKAAKSEASKLQKEFMQSGTKQDFKTFLSSKTLSTDPSTGGETIEEVILSELVKQAIDNQALLSNVGTRSVPDGSPLSVPTLLQYPTVEQTAENVNGDVVTETQGALFGTVTADYAKAFSMPAFTNEIIQDSVIDVTAETNSLVAEEWGFHFINQILFGAKEGATDPLQIRGILSDRVDAHNAYAEALKADADRKKEFYQVIKTGVADGLPATNEELVDFLIDIQTATPQAYQADAKWYMTRETFGILRKIKVGTDDLRPVLSAGFGTLNTTFTLLGKEIVLVDQMPQVGSNTCPIIYGDLKGAFEFVKVENSNHSVVDPYTIKGQVLYYNENRFGGLMKNHDAIRIVLCAA